MAIRRVLFLIQASRLVLLFVFWFFKSHFLPTNKAPSALRGGRFVGERVRLEPLGMTVRSGVVPAIPAIRCSRPSLSAGRESGGSAEERRASSPFPAVTLVPRSSPFGRVQKQRRSPDVGRFFLFRQKMQVELDFSGRDDYNDSETILRRGWRPARRLH